VLTGFRYASAFFLWKLRHSLNGGRDGGRLTGDEGRRVFCYLSNIINTVPRRFAEQPNSLAFLGRYDEFRISW
jgi:hypothetical protein